MILVDQALARRQQDGDPIKVAMIGAGAMGKALAYQLINHVPGMELVAIANRTVAQAEGRTAMRGWLTSAMPMTWMPSRTCSAGAAVP